MSTSHHFTSSAFGSSPKQRDRRSGWRLAESLMRSRGCLFTFHRAAPSTRWADLPNRDYYLDLGFLDRLLTYLKAKNWAVVTVDEALERARSNTPGDRYVNFSIDDCYRDTFEDVVPLFRKHDVPVTLYVTSGYPDRTASFWYTGLEEGLATRARVKVGEQTIEVATAEEKRKAFGMIAARWDGPKADKFYLDFCRDNDLDPVAIGEQHAISWDMLDALRDDPYVEIGAHSVTHQRISSLTPEQAAFEIGESGARLRKRLGLPVRHFAFPYGRSCDCGPRDFALVRDTGFASAATTRKGLVRAGTDPYFLPRNTLNGAKQSMASVEAHLTGLSGLAAKWLGRV